MVRFLHTSDWQIGMKGGGLGQAGTLVAQQRIETIDRILSIAEEHDADFVLAAGDLFEDNRVSYSDVEAVARIIRDHPDVEIHAIPGNHDLPGPGMGGIHIAMAHGHLTTIAFGMHEEGITLPLDPAHVEHAGLDYLALGHWHGTRLIDAEDGRCRIAYSGTPEQTSYGEVDAGNVLLVEIEEKGSLPKVEVIRSGQLIWRNERVEFVEDENLDRLRRLLETANSDLLRLEISGELPEPLYSEYQQILERFREPILDLRVRDEQLRWRRSDEASLTLTDASLEEVLRRLHELHAAEGADSTTVREAIRLFGEFTREAGL